MQSYNASGDFGVSRTAMRISKKRFFALDHSKFDADAIVRIAHVSDADVIFTDSKPPRAIAKALRDNGVELRIA